MKTLAMIILLVCISPLTVGCSDAKTYGPYYGKVVDMETKEPIEGAAVLVVFYANEPGPAGSITRYADALETQTDKNGEFRIPEHMVTPEKRRYFLVPHGYFTIFKPGYGCYPMHKDVKPIFVPNGMLPPKESVTIELPRLKTIQERLSNTILPIGLDIPKEKYRILNDLINQELRILGRGRK